MDAVTLPLALLAGVVSFASPCCLPLVPVFIGYLVGTATPGTPHARRTALTQALAFVLGFTVVFIALWASVGLVGYVLRDHIGVLRAAGGAALIVLGLHVAGLIRISALYRQVRIPVRPAASTPSYPRSVLLGAAFAAGWTPCVGPILGGIIGLASVSDSAAQGTALLVAYALGLGIPFILVAVGATEVQRRLGWLRRHHSAVELVTGALLVLLGFLMITNTYAALTGRLTSFGG